MPYSDSIQKNCGVVGTVRQNRLVGVPLPSKKDASKDMSRGQMKSTYSEDICATVWRDSQPVYLMSNFTGPEPAGSCSRYGGRDKGYVNVPCPKLVLDYNQTMGGVDLLNQSTKHYGISVRLKKWYWSLITWFLNVMMVQAWRLFRHTWRHRHMLARAEEAAEDQLFEEGLAGLIRVEKEQKRKEREDMKKKKREEKKKEELPLLDFIRQVVEHIILTRSDVKEERVHQREMSKLSEAARQFVRLDHSRAHFVISSEIKGGVCQKCKNRTKYRCRTCNVALHPECFVSYHEA